MFINAKKENRIRFIFFFFAFFVCWMKTLELVGLERLSDDYYTSFLSQSAKERKISPSRFFFSLSSRDHDAAR